jgi:hypothetical protein
MAKLRPAGKGKSAPQTRSTWASAIPCLFIVLGGLALLGVLFYTFVKGS